jgi:hypothetical protein
VIHPGEVHTGYLANVATGWTYRMLYPDVSLLRWAIAEMPGRSTLPYFPDAVIQDPMLAQQILKLHVALEGSFQLERDVRMLGTMAQLVRWLAWGWGKVETALKEGFHPSSKPPPQQG